MEHRLVAGGKRRADALALGRITPARGGRNCAVMRGEAHEHGVAAVLLARELADVQLAALTHLRRPRVAYVGVVRPDGDLRASAPPLEVRDERVERLGHV